MLSLCDPAKCTSCPYFDEEWEKCYGDGHQRELELKKYDCTGIACARCQYRDICEHDR